MTAILGTQVRMGMLCHDAEVCVLLGVGVCT